VGLKKLEIAFVWIELHMLAMIYYYKCSDVIFQMPTVCFGAVLHHFLVYRHNRHRQSSNKIRHFSSHLRNCLDSVNWFRIHHLFQGLVTPNQFRVPICISLAHVLNSTAFWYFTIQKALEFKVPQFLVQYQRDESCVTDLYTNDSLLHALCRWSIPLS
jgi:hypothetical protein